jgi:hypothetical protein
MRRSISKPPSGFFYITEVVNGYNHIISDSKNIIPPVTSNDQGIPTIIHDIAASIKSRLDIQWRSDKSTNVEKMRRSRMSIETDDEGDIYPGEFSGYANNNLLSMIELQGLRKKSPAVRKVKRSIKPCKCKPKRRSK